MTANENASEIEVRIPKQIFTAHNIVMALSALGVLGGGAAMAGAPTRAEIDELKAENAAMEAVLRGRRQVLSEAVTRINILCDRDPRCGDRFPPLAMPE